MMCPPTIGSDVTFTFSVEFGFFQPIGSDSLAVPSIYSCHDWSAAYRDVQFVAWESQEQTLYRRVVVCQISKSRPPDVDGFVRWLS